MKRSLLWTILSALIVCPLMLTACATGGSSAADEPNMDVTRWHGDARLYRILLPYPIDAAHEDSLAAYFAEHGAATNYLLAEAAVDPDAPVAVRVNALGVLARRHDDSQMHVFRTALDAEDVRVRASAVAAMRELITAYPREATRIARMALSDSAPEVQAQALQVLSDREIDVLREYIPRAPNAELRAIAQDLVTLAEQRGAPLRPDTVSGVLTRDTPGGFRISFTPARRWPDWNAAVGTVRVSKDDSTLHVIDGIEVVGGVIPVFMSPDGRHVVFERDRHIFVRNLADGIEVTAGPGIAPRVLPFTQEFVFLREKPEDATEKREETQLAYDVFSAPFDPPRTLVPGLIGATTATVSFGRNGAYSPVRWMRVEERAGSFYLTSSHMEIVSLPDPFG